MFNLATGFLSGVGVFVFAIFLLNASLSNKELKLPVRIEKRLSNPLVGFFTGTAFSMLTQSSSAVNSIIVQLSDKKLIKEKSAYYVVMGTNIGTTITAYIVILSKLNFSEIFVALIFIGSISLMILKNEKLRYVSFWICVFSLIFVGLSIISDTIPKMIELISYNLFAKNNPLYMLLISTLITAICQSSSLISVIVVTLSGLGIIPIDNAMFMIIGANVGTCSTALLVSIGKSRSGINVALFNLLFNVLGLLVHLFAYYTHLLDWFINLNVSEDTKIALYHTLFNVSSVLFTLPIVSELEKLLNTSRMKGKTT